MVQLIKMDIKPEDIKSEKSLNKAYNDTVQSFLTANKEHNNSEWIIKGYYFRKVDFYLEIYTLQVLVLENEETHKCHALLPDFLIPYRQKVKDLILIMLRTYLKEKQICFSNFDYAYVYSCLHKIVNFPTESETDPRYLNFHLFYHVVPLKRFMSHKVKIIHIDFIEEINNSIDSLLPRQQPNNCISKLIFEMIS